MPEYILRDPTAVDRGCGRGGGGRCQFGQNSVYYTGSIYFDSEWNVT